MTGKRLARHPGRRLRRLSERCFYRPLVTTWFFFLLLAYLEFFVKIACHLFSWDGALWTLLFSLPVAALLGLLCAAVPVRAGRALLILCTGLLTVWLGAQMVYYDLFQTFFSLFSVTMAGMVFGDFGGQAAALIGENLLRILFFAIPFVLAVVFRRRLVPEGGESWRVRCLWAAGAAALQLLAVMLVLQMTAGTLPLRYLYLQSDAQPRQVAQFGVVTATRLELRRALFGTPVEPPVQPVEELEQPPATENDMDEASPAEDIPVVYGDNVLNIDFDALIAGESDETLRSMHQYFASVTPTKQNEWTGYFAGKNLIWIVAEAYSSIAIDPELTPTLYRLSQEGFRFENFYTPSWGVSTSDGEYVTTTGLIPKGGVWSYLRSGENYMPFGFGHLFSAQGYRTLAYHDHTYTYYGRDVSYPNMGYEYYGVGNGLDVRETWPESDVEMMEVSVPQYIDEDRFMVYYLTVSGHLQYNFMGNYIAYKNRELVADLPYSEAARAYMACQIELDRAVENLIDQLRAAGKLEDTVIVLSGDHYPYGLTNEQFSELLGHEVDPAFELYKSTLLLWNAEMEEPVTVEKYCSSLVVMPTLANLFALPYDSRLVMGRDILSDAPGLVIFSDYSFLTDQGAYVASKDQYTPWGGGEPDYDYVRRVLSDVTNRFTYSRLILEKDYYQAVLGKEN